MQLHSSELAQLIRLAACVQEMDKELGRYHTTNASMHAALADANKQQVALRQEVTQSFFATRALETHKRYAYKRLTCYLCLSLNIVFTALIKRIMIYRATRVCRFSAVLIHVVISHSLPYQDCRCGIGARVSRRRQQNNVSQT